MNKNIYTALAALSLALSAPAEEVKFSELPNAAQRTINRNLYGGVVQEIDREIDSGRTVYQVEIRREGKNRHLRVDADGKLLAASKVENASVEVDVDQGGVFDKNDGKILGVIDKPSEPSDTPGDKDDFKAEAQVGEDSASIETKVDQPRDRGVTEDLFDKNDGKILDVLPAPGNRDGASVETKVDVDSDSNKKLEAEVDLDTGDQDVAVEANSGEGKGVFRKGDGKILGIPVPGRNAESDAEVAVDVDTNQDHVTTEVDGGLDTDKNDGRILGVPKRGFETLSMADLPPVVRETVRREAGGYKIAEIEKATADGRAVYEVDIERDGKNRELHIAMDGTILKDTDREAVGAPATIERGQNRE